MLVLKNIQSPKKEAIIKLAKSNSIVDIINGTPYELIRTIFNEKGYRFQGDRPYEPTIIGIRSNDLEPETFNDFGLVLWKNDYWQDEFLSFEMTTDPGIYYRENPLNVLGTGIIADQQIKKGLRLGYHRKYKALVQNKPFYVYRDNNRDKKIDLTDLVLAYPKDGFNLHRALESHYDFTSKVGKFSAGCQVVWSTLKFEFIITLCEICCSRYGVSEFDYTLLLEKDFII